MITFLSGDEKRVQGNYIAAIIYNRGKIVYFKADKNGKLQSAFFRETYWQSKKRLSR